MEQVGKVTIDVETDGLDEAVEKAGELSELVSEMAPQVIIRNSRNCIFNITIGGQE